MESCSTENNQSNGGIGNPDLSNHEPLSTGEHDQGVGHNPSDSDSDSDSNSDNSDHHTVPTLTQLLFAPNAQSHSNVDSEDDAVADADDADNQRPDSVWFVLQRVFQIYMASQQARMLIGLAATCTLPITAALMLITNRIVHNSNLFHNNNNYRHDVDGGDISKRHFLTQNFVGIFLILMTQLLFHHAVGIWSDGAICRAAAEIALGRPTAARQAWRHLLQWKLALILTVTGMLSFVFILIGYCFFYVVGLLAVVALYLTVPALILEPQQTRHPLDALSRSFELTQGCLVHCLLCHVVLILIQSITAHIVNAIFMAGSNSSNLGHLFSVWGTWVGMIPTLLFVPAFSILKTVLYIRIRVRREGLTPQQLARDMKSQIGGIHDRTDHSHPLLTSDEEATQSLLDHHDDDDHNDYRHLLTSDQYIRQSAGSLLQQPGTASGAAMVAPMAAAGNSQTLINGSRGSGDGNSGGGSGGSSLLTMRGGPLPSMPEEEEATTTTHHDESCEEVPVETSLNNHYPHHQDPDNSNGSGSHATAEDEIVSSDATG
eukprot:CAMPEP_0168774982 /NCGR_PEP_ID=MMETSP0725-20121227/5275_1 /TAXON_ID=265536 /ORGANISM="Amphiprora sp., Strain CCMP467" /LENGTH=544 /DNA_ID=CAMNT_0008824593 /DNA_START=20 /DNA_END=1654 /DNA_ORIENTATION=-